MLNHKASVEQQLGVENRNKNSMKCLISFQIAVLIALTQLRKVSAENVAVFSICMIEPGVYFFFEQISRARKTEIFAL